MITDRSPTHDPFSRGTNDFNTEIIKLKTVVFYLNFFFGIWVGHIVWTRDVDPPMSDDDDDDDDWKRDSNTR